MERGLQGYAMKPRPGTKFMKRDVEKKLEEILTAKVGREPYNHDLTQPLTKDLCSEIQSAVTNMGYERYKLVVQVTIAEAAAQGLRISSRCLWDPEVDNFAEFTYSNEFQHVTALVFACYWE